MKIKMDLNHPTCETMMTWDEKSLIEHLELCNCIAGNNALMQVQSDVRKNKILKRMGKTAPSGLTKIHGHPNRRWFPQRKH